MAYETEEQQVEAIKQFWKENGTAIILGAVIGFGGLFGWNYYQDYQTRQGELASQAFSEVVSLADSGASAEQLIEKVTSIQQEHASSSYATLAALTLAEKLVEEDKFAEAAEQLKWAVDQSNDTFESIAQLRLARLQLQLEQFDAAISTVESIDDEAYRGSALFIKGEALLAQDKLDQAKSVFMEARDAENATPNPLLQLRLSELGIEQ